MVLANLDINGVSANAHVDLNWLQTSRRARRVVAVGLGGSAAAGDTKIALYYGDYLVGEYDNTTTNDVVDKTQLRFISTKYVLGPKVPLNVKIVTASGSACYLTLVIKNLPRGRRGRR